MSIPLLKTKLYIPPPRPNLVPRPRLMARLGEALGLRHRLTLISAKAGTGKTTLVSEWLHEQERPATWLSLDGNDNDPRRFFNYLIAALYQLGIRTEPGWSEPPQLPQAEALVAELINDVATSSTPFLLVLDDYHVIENEWIHQAVGFLVDHQPLEMHLVVITRTDPPLPLGRLRGRGQVTEIRDHDLRFTAEEAASFLRVMELDLPAEAISTLERRTEGWIVGLQMAAISMRGRKQDGDLAAFIEAFGGTNRYVLDYLTEEVLNQQASAIQDFLVETSILSRMCADLCDAVRFGEAESPSTFSGPEMRPSQGGTSESQAILAHLQRSNLFVMSLDDERRWYRYHHLFADLLESTLRQHRSTEQIRGLHRRASQWHQGKGSLEEAMIHAMAAQDFERAAEIIDENIVSMLSQSEGPILLGWIEKLPQQIVIGRPWVDVYRAYTLALSGRPDEADSLLEGVEKRIDPSDSRAEELVGHIAAIRSYTANLWGDADRAFEMATLADECLLEEHLVARGMATYALTVTHFANDDMDSSIRAARKMLEIGKELNRLLMIVTALCDLASANKVQGRLHQAQEHYDRARRWMAERNSLDSRVRCAYEAGMADLMFRKNRLDEAHEHAVTGIEFCRRYNVPSEMVSSYVTLIRVLQAQGDVEGALGALRDAEQVMQTHHLRLATKINLMASRVVQWLAVGDVETASRWAEEGSGGSELEQIALARLCLAQGRAADAQRLLDHRRPLAEAGGRTGRLIEILSLQALALEALDRPGDATAALSQALSLARSEGYVRLFLELGEPLRRLLAQLATVDTASEAGDAPIARVTGDYVRSLLVAFPREREAMHQVPPQSDGLLEPLTKRELEVLRLLAEGLSNKAIAAELVVAPSTVKQHLKNIYGKLDVHSRTQAVARSRELELL